MLGDVYFRGKNLDHKKSFSRVISVGVQREGIPLFISFAINKTDMKTLVLHFDFAKKLVYFAKLPLAEFTKSHCLDV